MKITYYRKNVYGTELMYIVEPEQAKAYTAISGRKTFSEKDIEPLKKLGIEVTEVLPPRK